MTKHQAITYIEPLVKALETHFHQHFMVRGGKHWIGRPEPIIYAKDLIKIKVKHAGKASYGRHIMVFDIIIQSLDPRYVAAHFKMDVLKNSVNGAFFGEVINDWVDFTDQSVGIVVKRDNYYFHIHLFNQFN